MGGVAETVFASEIQAEARATYAANFGPREEPAGDVSDLECGDIPPFELLTAGFPCQSFSQAGAQEGFGNGGGNGRLFFEIIRVANHHRPPMMLLENVANLVHKDPTSRVQC